MRKLLSVIVCLFAGVTMLMAQNRSVTGTVISNEDGEPIFGATIRVSGTSVGTTTDGDGKFSLSVPQDAKTLEITYVGMEPVTVPVRSKIRVLLKSDEQYLDEVMVVAYGTARREAKTGSITTMSAKEIVDVPATSIDKILGGKLAGVQVSQNSGQPGSTSQIRIRGISSINAGSEPLYVVDGVPIMSGEDAYFTNTNNPLASINPNDIANVTVLKDAAAASIYGSRAANGVILITTKSGQEGKSQISVRAKYGISQLANDNNFGVLNAQQLLEYQRQAIINSGRNPDDPTNASSYYRPYSLLTGQLTNWMDAMTRTGKLQEYELTLSGGSPKTKYYSSISYHDNEGIYYGVDFKRLQARLNADHEINKYLKTGTRVNAAYTYGEDVPMQSLYYANPAFSGMTVKPWDRFLNDDGTFNTDLPSNSNTNPRATAEYDDQWQKKWNFNGSMYLEYKPIKQLVFKTTNAAELTFIRGRRYWSLEASNYESGYPVLQTNQTQYEQYTTSNTVNYSDEWKGHSLSAMFGQEAMRYKYTNDYQSSEGLNPNIPYHVSGNSTNDLSYNVSTETLLSWFGNLDYNYDSRYYLQASVRWDGSSLFGSNTKWGTFWSVGASWNAHNEKFLKDYKWLDLAKLRVSYGVNGNNNITNYLQYGTYSATTYNGISGLYPSVPANPDLSWEKNKAFNVGIDFRFLKKFSGSIDFYTRKTTDMLLAKSLSYTSGFSSATTNIGSMRNTGVEFQFDANIIDKNDWSWDLGFNISHNKSKVLDLAGDEQMDYSEDSRIKHFVGERLYTFYLLDYFGVNPQNGEALWVAEDGSLTNNYNSARRIKAGSPEPSFTGGINTTLKWKDLSLSIVTEFKGGNKVLIVENRYLQSDGNQMTMNQVKSVLNYWKNPGDTGVNPKPVAGNSSNSYSFNSDRFLEDGSYFRIKDITLSYQLPRDWMRKIGLNTVRVYASGLNLYTFHDVNFWDPERGIDGMGYGIYPVTKSFVVGLDITL